MVAINEETKINFGEMIVKIKQDPSITNTNRFCTEKIIWKNFEFRGEEIILLKSILTGFVGNRMTARKIYKITDEINAKMEKRSDAVMLVFEGACKLVAMLDKIYAQYTSDVLRAILSRLPVYIF